jgi:glycosyltransferase involved in cell wall biosynthesis
VELVPNGADPAMFAPSDDGDAFRAQHGLEGRFVVLYAGAHGLSNDLGVVLQAADELRDDPRLAIVLLGSGKDKAALQAQAVAMGLENVCFLPPVPKLEMGQALAAADACLAILKPIPLYATVFPNKVFDYMAAGRPVILAIDGVIRQVVEAAESGVFAPPGDPAALAQAIRQLADDPQRAREMGLNGRRCLEQSYDRARLSAQLAEIMEAMARERRS